MPRRDVTTNIHPNYLARAQANLAQNENRDCKAALKKTLFSGSTPMLLSIIGLAGLICPIMPIGYVFAAPLVYASYKQIKLEYDDNLEQIQRQTLDEFSITLMPEVQESVTAYLAAQDIFDNEPFHHPPVYTEVDVNPPSYQFTEQYVAQPLPPHVKETSF